MSRADALGGTSGTITSTSGSTFTGPYSSGNTSAPSSGGFDLDLGDMLSGAFKTEERYDYGKILGAAGGAASCLVCSVKVFNWPMGYQGSIPSYTVSRMQVPGLTTLIGVPAVVGSGILLMFGLTVETHLNRLRVWKLNRANLLHETDRDSHLRPFVPQKTQPLLKLQHKLH